MLMTPDTKAANVNVNSAPSAGGLVGSKAIVNWTPKIPGLKLPVYVAASADSVKTRFFDVVLFNVIVALARFVPVS